MLDLILSVLSKTLLLLLCLLLFIGPFVGLFVKRPDDDKDKEGDQ
jgi:hypothetical protein